MRYIQPDSLDAGFHFSVETYLLEQAPLDEPVFMIWQSRPCTMLGRFQVAQAELDLDYAAKEDILIVRRPSGGGTIFVDDGTLLYSLLLPCQDGDACIEQSRAFFSQGVSRALNKLGIPAVIEGRNDILVEGKKIAGIAQHMKNGWICTHGSLLFDANLDMLSTVLKPDDDKIRSKAIASVRSRVTNLRSYLSSDLSTAEFWELLAKTLAEEWNLTPYTLLPAEIARVEEIHREKFGNPEWTFGQTPKFTFQNSTRLPAGKIEVFFDVAQNRIVSAAIHGDFLGVTSIRELEAVFEGLPFDRPALDHALSNIDLAPYLGGITKDQLLACIFA